MDINEFIEQINSRYDLIKDEDEDEYEFDRYIGLYIEIDKINKTFGIFREFTHPLYDYEEYEHEGEVIVYESTYFEAILKENFLSSPEIGGNNYVGAPFDDERIGYFGIEFNLEFVNKFLMVYDDWLQKISGVESEDLEEEQIFQNLISAKWETLKNNLIDKGYILDNNFIKRYDNSIILTPLVYKENFNIDLDTFMKIDTIHSGIKYFLCQVNDQYQYISVCKEIFNEVKSSLELVEYCDDIELYTDLKRYIYLKNSWICGLIVIYDNVDYARNFEYHLLDELFKTFNSFIPSEMVRNLHFTHLNDKSFESLTMDFLNKERYYDIHPLGKTNAADGGRDFLAKKKKFDVLVKENAEQWIVQCKFTKSDKIKYFSRAMISEIPDLLGENYANKYLLVTSAYLSPQIIDRIMHINRVNGNIIEFYAIDEFKLALSKYPDLIKKYELIVDNE